MRLADDDCRPGSHELRRALRPRTLLGGKIVFRDGSCSFDCIVRDMSGDGARIKIAPDQFVQKRFYLLTPKHDFAFDAEVVWRRGGLLGLKIRRFDLSGSNLLFLKQLSAELRPRPRIIDGT